MRRAVPLTMIWECQRFGQCLCMVCQIGTSIKLKKGMMIISTNSKICIRVFMHDSNIGKWPHRAIAFHSAYVSIARRRKVI